ncbi:hypothetical protein CPJCM30710_33940 [Clostridium polyendosporum]|uniref:Uncharacterized protein n=1 Tax=Clostridium polyendosporum TaxID=69208 RepID=A0A919S537_9CLOT|nr:hypothetical protein CPJCM30710_33940 [Clostridium polyendosporum]
MPGGKSHSIAVRLFYFDFSPLSTLRAKHKTTRYAGGDIRLYKKLTFSL